MPNSPARIVPVVVGPIDHRERRAVTARRKMEEGLLAHTLRSHFDKEAACIDAESAFEASKAALDCELATLEWGLKRAQAMGSAAASKLVSDRVEQLSRINSQNLSRRYGA